MMKMAQNEYSFFLSSQRGKFLFRVEMLVLEEGEIIEVCTFISMYFFH